MPHESVWKSEEATKKAGHLETTLAEVRKQAEGFEQAAKGLEGERDELKRLRAENTQLRRANEILKAASAIFAAGLDRPRTR